MKSTVAALKSEMDRAAFLEYFFGDLKTAKEKQEMMQLWTDLNDRQFVASVYGETGLRYESL